MSEDNKTGRHQLKLVPIEPDAACIALAEEILEKARSGEITSLAAGALSPDSTPLWFVSEHCSFSVIAPLMIAVSELQAEARESAS